jgi:hypothetical protein
MLVFESLGEVRLRLLLRDAVNALPLLLAALAVLFRGQVQRRDVAVQHLLHLGEAPRFGHEQRLLVVQVADGGHGTAKLEHARGAGRGLSLSFGFALSHCVGRRARERSPMRKERG